MYHPYQPFKPIYPRLFLGNDFRHSTSESRIEDFVGFGFREFEKWFTLLVQITSF